MAYIGMLEVNLFGNWVIIIELIRLKNPRKLWKNLENLFFDKILYLKGVYTIETIAYYSIRIGLSFEMLNIKFCEDLKILDKIV